MLKSTLITTAAIGAAVVSGVPVTQNSLSFAVENGINYTVFDHAATGTQMKFVKNSGICETARDVNQYSGYLSVGPHQNMWFWFFEARSNASTAPLAAWFNGGPGCSSMMGLFQENGPCHFVDGSSEPTMNPYSWNNVANMLYVDQPIGVGFSWGESDVSSTVTAAQAVWKLIQAFYDQFEQYSNRDFGIFTESYGGHYGPEFAAYISEQNAAIDAGTATGHKINLAALGINNGWIDPAIQYQATIEYAHKNPYKQLIDADQRAALAEIYEESCAPLLAQCGSTTGNNSACVAASDTCSRLVFDPIVRAGGSNFSIYDVRAPLHDPNPPKTYEAYLNRADVVRRIGARGPFKACDSAAGKKIRETGDHSRSFMERLWGVVRSGVRVVLWAGDADFICNGFGTEEVAFQLIERLPGGKIWHSMAIHPFYTADKQVGREGGYGNLSWVEVWGAGHEVPFYQPAAALQVFRETMGLGRGW